MEKTFIRCGFYSGFQQVLCHFDAILICDVLLVRLVCLIVIKIVLTANTIAFTITKFKGESFDFLKNNKHILFSCTVLPEYSHSEVF